ncbi:hypothetical protein RFEPED_0619 [Rickettsia felis str. Pedreira]|uniref:Uncharacterized protein n=1 Tax=Rickettsia felis str. Pedreira TaxID=1359196 RepID=A0A0F3MRG8_RICFI|nr:hypothetical protein RFEPED_0619 [Rickettsia felis str. Pedreira]
MLRQNLQFFLAMTEKPIYATTPTLCGNDIKAFYIRRINS